MRKYIHNKEHWYVIKTLYTANKGSKDCGYDMKNSFSDVFLKTRKLVLNIFSNVVTHILHILRLHPECTE